MTTKERPKSKKQLQKEEEIRVRKAKYEEAVLQHFLADQVEVLRFVDENIERIVPEIVHHGNMMVSIQPMPVRIKKLFALAELGKKASETDIVKENEELKKDIRYLENKIKRAKELMEML